MAMMPYRPLRIAAGAVIRVCNTVPVMHFAVVMVLAVVAAVMLRAVFVVPVAVVTCGGCMVILAVMPMV